ncbi:hypothetical protein RCZ15_07910 [Capnocytophaga catalasegens]|uniref:Uncharacterized protein n=1 Tax=Capnocytophaga catalasegens TaxID=1004260 RepID=A0AAV5AVE2_9FLAO|nr:hypothetical protein RCZ03_18040 [Capnocytophaga catalasegens]GJM49816.1 hypothetical protein RCZ15_07910 [Capnocytophaga catalasegens]GJM52981.1 hypothetical protein RCZ16_12980 [Capnocytophaga catalasegens]
MIYHNVNNFAGEKYNLFPYKNTFLQRALDIRIKIANYFFELYFRKIICKIKKKEHIRSLSPQPKWTNGGNLILIILKKVEK